MDIPMNTYGHKVHRLVLTGGPCGGKTTAQALLTTVFEPLGWKVFRTPEVATVLFSGGVRMTEMTRADRYKFEENLMKTTLHIEKTYFDLAMTQHQDVLIICDRGFMDAVAYLDDQNDWNELKSINKWNEVDLRDRRYDHVVHLVTAADGAEPFYTTVNNRQRSETPELARTLDQMCQRAWLGHAAFDVIDNSTGFPEKMNRLVRCVALRMGVDLTDRFDLCASKRKWLVKAMGPDGAFPKFEDFDELQIYLLSSTPGVEAKIRRRRKPGNTVCSYQYTLRRNGDGRRTERRQQLTRRDFDVFATQRDMDHAIVEMRRRCFLYKNNYFQLDICRLPSNCAGLMILTTYTLRTTEVSLPEFITIAREVTDDPAYSLFNLTQRSYQRSNSTNSQHDEPAAASSSSPPSRMMAI